MEQTTIEALRPEYLDAVGAARWNLWLIPLFATAPLLLLLAVLRRWHWAIIVGAAIIAAIGTWVSLFAYSETIWKTMEAHAQTAAEMDEVASDTGRVLGPFLLGIPFAFVYTVAWCGAAIAARVVIARAARKVPPELPNKSE